MDFTQIFRYIVQVQEGLRALETLKVERRRVMALIEAAEAKGEKVDFAIVVAELDDLKQAIEAAKAAVPEEPADPPPA